MLVGGWGVSAWAAEGAAFRKALRSWAEGRRVQAVATLDEAERGGGIRWQDGMEGLPAEALVPAAVMVERWLRELAGDEAGWWRMRRGGKALEGLVEKYVEESEDRPEARVVAARIWASAGAALRDRGRYGWARELWQRAVSLDPGCTAAWQARASLSEKQGRYQDAVEALDALLATAPGDAEAQLRRAVVAARLEEPGASDRLKALAESGGATVVTPSSPSGVASGAGSHPPEWVRAVAAEEWARGLVAMGRREEAITALRWGRDRFPEEPQLGVLLLSLLDDRSPESRELIDALSAGASDQGMTGRTRYNLWPQDMETLRRHLAEDDVARRGVLLEALSQTLTPSIPLSQPSTQPLRERRKPNPEISTASLRDGRGRPSPGRTVRAASTTLVQVSTTGGGTPPLPRVGETATEVEVRFLSPAEGEPLYGPSVIEVAVEPVGGAATETATETTAETTGGMPKITVVVLRLDGVPAAQVTAAPWRFELDAGTSGAARRLEVLVYGSRGLLATAERSTPAVRVDEEVDLRLQQLYVTVTDRGGQRVPGLARDDFRVFDDGERQRLVTFEGGDVPFTAVLLLDGSQSMIGQPFAAARAGARAFLSRMGPLDEAALSIFSGRVLEATPFTGDPRVHFGALDRASTRGGSAIHDHLYLALRRLEERQGRRVMILLSDGRDVHSILDMEAVRGALRRAQVQLYWVRRGDGRGGIHSWRPPAESRRQYRLLERTVTESGGRTLTVGDEGVEEAFREILRELREQYVLGYYPEAKVPGGCWHRLRVTVRGGFEVRTAEGYAVEAGTAACPEDNPAGPTLGEP